jgi:hypothetical protein
LRIVEVATLAMLEQLRRLDIMDGVAMRAVERLELEEFGVGGGGRRGAGAI